MGKTIEIAYLKRRARGAEWKKLRVRDEGPLSPGELIGTLIRLSARARSCRPSDNLWVYFNKGSLVVGIQHPRETVDAWVKRHSIKDDNGQPLYLMLSRAT